MIWATTTTLSEKLAISDRTVRDWCLKDPELGHKDGFVWAVNIRRLAASKNIDLVELLLLLQSPDTQLIKASKLALISGVHRRTVANWCKTRPGFAIQIGHVWFVDVGKFGVTPAEICARRREQKLDGDQ